MLITTLVVSFYKDGGGSVNVKLRFLVVRVRCEVLCRLVVAGNVFLLMNTNWQHTDITLRGSSISHLMQNAKKENG